MKRIHVVEMNKYVRLDPLSLIQQSTKWITNGVNNDYFVTVENAYLGSPTNAAIIDNYTNYILGEGLYDKTNVTDVEDILSDEDLRSAVSDYKIQGACALQVIYNFGGTINKLYYVPVKSLAINREPDITDDVTAYWHSFDWRYRTKYVPTKVAAFGCGDGLETEILYIKRHSTQPLYALPDWQQGIQYAQTEEELSNYYNKHIKNNFSAGKIVNINQGGTDSDEAMDEAERAIVGKVSGSNNAGNVIVSFNDNYENRTTVESIEITDAYSQFQFLSTECVEKIMLSHKVNDRGLFSLPTPTGFASAAEQQAQALKILYRSQINPLRKSLIKGLEQAFKLNNPNIQLAFKDFEELDVEVVKPEVNMVTNKVSFDWDDTLTTEKGISLLEEAIRANRDVYIISARNSEDAIKAFAERYNIPLTKVFAVGSNNAKVEKIKELGIDTHYDNNPSVVALLPGIGKNIN